MKRYLTLAFLLFVYTNTLFSQEKDNNSNTEIQKQLNRYAKKIEFKLKKASLTENSIQVLNSVIDLMKKHPNKNFVINGYTDAMGSYSSNLNLSELRAKTVMTYFISNGINISRLSAKGYGEKHPIANNKTSDGRKKNRRIEIKISN